MAWCPRCKLAWREPPGEEGDHCCPRCGDWRTDLDEEDWLDDTDEEDDDAEG